MGKGVHAERISNQAWGFQEQKDWRPQVEVVPKSDWIRYRDAEISATHLYLRERASGGTSARVLRPGAAEPHKQKLAEFGLKGRVRANQTGCLDQCEHGPNVVIYLGDNGLVRVIAVFLVSRRRNSMSDVLFGNISDIHTIESITRRHSHSLRLWPNICRSSFCYGLSEQDR